MKSSSSNKTNKTESPSYLKSSLINLLTSRRNEILLLVIALGARVLTTEIQITFGIHSINALPGAVAWSDFFTLNGGQVHALSQGLVPYRDFGYWYTPLFLYVLYPFYHLGLETAVVPIMVSDAATAPLIYLLVRSHSSERIALVAGLAYALSPFVLYEEGYLFLSSQPMVFFMLLSLYFLLNERPIVASVALAISIMFKQEALFVLPIYVASYFVKHKMNAWKGLLILIGIVVGISSPFLIISPAAYLVDTSYGIIPLHAGSNAISTTISAIGGSGNSSLHGCSSPIPTTLTSASLVACGITYLWSAPTALDRFSELLSIVGWSLRITEVPILLMIVPLLYMARRKSYFFVILSSYSIVAFLVLFSFTVHELFSYYFLPVYALIMASIRTRGSALIAVVLSIISIAIPDGTSYPVLLSMIGIICILASRDSAEGFPKDIAIISSTVD